MGLFGPDREAKRVADNVTRQLAEKRAAQEREDRRRADERRRANPPRSKDRLSNTKRTR
jgi:hypothetical protein